MWKYEKLLVLLLLVGLIAVRIIHPSQYVYRVLTMICIYSVLSLSLNVILGFTGMLSMGHAAFYAIGGYISALLGTKLGLNFFLTALIGALGAGLFGMLLGMPTLRLSGSYLAITTMGFAEVVRMVLLSWEDVTNGAFGIQNIPRPEIFGYEFTTANGGFYLLGIVMLAIVLYLTSTLNSSRYGRALRAVKNDELATTLMGVNVNYFKVLAFTISAAIAGFAGAFYASMARYIEPNTFNFDISMMILCIVILGGMGSIKGMVVASVLLVSFPEVLRSLAEFRFVAYGIILILMMRFRPQGILGGMSTRPYKYPKGVTKGKEADAK